MRVICLDEIRGQDHAKVLITRALAKGQLPGAYLFAGPEGVGKRTSALALAMAANCETLPGRGCKTCLSCTKIANGAHPDMILLAPQGAGGFILVEDVRTLIGRLAFAPHEGRMRLVLVESADRLRVEAANALLKTLEEPPARTIFVLETAAPEKLLPTIRSRCQRIRFAPLATAALVGILTDEGVAESRAREVAPLAGGSAQVALELARGDVLERRRVLAERMLAAVGANGWKAVFDVASEVAEEKEDIAPTLEVLAFWYRDAAVGQATGIVPAELPATLRSARSKSSELAKSARSILMARDALSGFANPQLTLERLMFALRASM